MKKDWKFRHLAFVVKDIDEVIQYYESLGLVSAISPERLMEWPNKAKSKLRFVQIGSLVIEFYQPVEGKSIHSDFLKKHGEGIQRIAFAVDDIDQEVDELVDRGGTLMFRGDMPNGSRIAYFDTGKIGDILIALVQPTGGVETLINDQ
jgi:4-hydroxyphenylpyruvate dioxygenase-like putative hemolysin